MKFVKNGMYFHFEWEGYLQKVDSFRDISKKTPKIEIYLPFIFTMFRHEILLANLKFGFSTPKNNI